MASRPGRRTADADEEDLPPMLRLIDESGGNLGELDAEAARQAADDRSRSSGERLVLVLVSPNAKPPVYRLVARAEQARKEREAADRERAAKEAARKAAGRIKGLGKEVQMSGWVAEHDLEVKVKQIRKFLSKGQLVRLTIKHKRGQSQNRKQQEDVIKAVTERVADLAKPIAEPKRSGGFGLMVSTTFEPLPHIASGGDSSSNEDAA